MSNLREVAKGVARAGATLAVLPLLCSFALRARMLGPNRALEGSTQWLAGIPGLVGQYLRVAFLRRVLAECHYTAAVEFGTIFSQVGARVGENVYIGPRCHIGLAYLERDVLIAAGVHVPSGAMRHGIGDISTPIREQPGKVVGVRVGRGSWVGSAAIVLADVGCDSVVGAGSVVSRPVPDLVVVAGVPARVLRSRVQVEGEGPGGDKGESPS